MHPLAMSEVLSSKTVLFCSASTTAPQLSSFLARRRDTSPSADGEECEDRLYCLANAHQLPYSLQELLIKDTLEDTSVVDEPRHLLVILVVHAMQDYSSLDEVRKQALLAQFKPLENRGFQGAASAPKEFIRQSEQQTSKSLILQELKGVSLSLLRPETKVLQHK